MKKYLLSLMLLFSVGITALPAVAVPFVQTNSNYTFYLQGNRSNDSLLGLVTFDATPATTVFRDKTITVNNTEISLRNGNSQLTFDLTIDSPGLFVNADELIIFGLGTDGNGFDFTQDVSLLNATITLYNENNEILATFEDVQDAVAQADPWNGLLPTVNDALGLGDPSLDARLVTRISVDFVLAGRATEVPEPGSILLCAIGLLATLLVLRRRV